MFISNFDSLTVKTGCRHHNYDIMTIRTIYVLYIKSSWRPSCKMAESCILSELFSANIAHIREREGVYGDQFWPMDYELQA